MPIQQERSSSKGSDPGRSAPLVSVVIPCFNGQDFIAEAIGSALSQSVTEIEVVVVDDGSTDSSRKIIEAEAKRDSRVVPLFLDQNAGPAAARNHGFSAAKGTWIALLDADDLYHANRLERLLDLAEKHDADVVADNQTMQDIGPSQPSPAFDFIKQGEVVHVDRRFFFSHIWETGGKYPMGLLKPMFRRSFVQRHGIVYDTRYRLGEDFLFYLNCMLNGAKFYLTGDEYYVYRRRPDSLSQAGSAAFLALASMCDEILETRRDALDPASVERLKHRRRESRKLGMNIQLKEIKALRRNRDYRGVLNYLARNPAAGIYLLTTGVLWRLRQWRAT
jgi:succinoglycan biosynthesis protein ExoO